MIQGVEGWDVDLPTSIEANAIVHTVAKVCWMVVYILVYGIRPLIIRPKPVGMADVINWGLVLAFDGVLLYTLGFKSLLYLLLGTLFGGGLHPIAGHLIQEHYMFVTVSHTIPTVCTWVWTQSLPSLVAMLGGCTYAWRGSLTYSRDLMSFYCVCVCVGVCMWISACTVSILLPGSISALITICAGMSRHHSFLDMRESSSCAMYMAVA